jgi:hypothetical protein
MGLFYLLPPFAAYALNEALVHGLGFIGMALLLADHLPLTRGRGLAVFGTALCFSLLPFFSIHGLTIAGLPLVVRAFANLRARQRRFLSLVIAALFPFWSAFHLSGVFLLSLLFVVFAVDLRLHRANRWFLLGLLLLFAFYVVAEFELLKLMVVGSDAPSHRSAWNEKTGTMNDDLAATVLNFAKSFFLGQYHAASQHLPVLLLALTATGLYLKKAAVDPLLLRRAWQLIALAAVLSLAYAIFSFKGMNPLKNAVPFLKTFNFGRYHWLHPLVWFAAFGCLLASLRETRWLRRVAAAFIALQLGFCVLPEWAAKQELRYNYQLLIGGTPDEPRVMPFNQVMSAPVFSDIARHIGGSPEDYRVINVGIEPFIAQYNGFHTLDSYQNNYPLPYKLTFRRIIAAELEKSAALKDSFDNWGSRCYTFAAQVPMKPFIRKSDDVAPVAPDFDMDAFEEMGGRYVFSTIPFSNGPALGLTLSATFEKSGYPWRIYLYSTR